GDVGRGRGARQRARDPSRRAGTALRPLLSRRGRRRRLRPRPRDRARSGRNDRRHDPRPLGRRRRHDRLGRPPGRGDGAHVSARILLADDESDLVAPVRWTLTSEGFTVDAVGDGEQALEAARTGAYDVVILDVMMPTLSGLEVCRRLRAESVVPIIMLTAKDAEA